MSGRYLIVVPVTKAYISECEVLLKSLCVNNPGIPVHLITRENEGDVMALGKKYPIVKRIHLEPYPTDLALQINGEFRQVRTSRFRYAADVKDDFDVVLLLDSDMWSLRPMDNIFKMAECGTILVGGNSTMFRYTHKDFLALKIDAPLDINFVHNSFCTVPTFINPSIHEDFLRAIYNSPSGNDLDVPNLLSITMGLVDNLYYLPSQNWLNIHHASLKPELFCIKTDRGIMSKTGEPVYMMHGHWGDPNYYGEQLIEPMVKNYGYHQPYIDCARNCIRILKENYDYYAGLSI